MPRTFTLTPELVAANAGGPVVCLDARAVGREHRAYRHRPGPHRNTRIEAPKRGAFLVSADEGQLDVESPAASPVLIRVDICGPLEQRAGQHDPSGSWCMGHDTVAESLCAALAEGDVLLVIDSPGGAHAGLQQAIDLVLRVKEQYGRRVTVFANEMIGSAAYWWAACVGDEIWGPESMIVGSIGARAAHISEAGALAQAGVAVTYGAWPGPGKVAFAPELPLSEEGKARLDRDVGIAGEAFAAAVGPRRGLSRDDIMKLDADALSGAAAVAAKLADGIASLEDVTAYALAMAGGGEGTMPETEDRLTYEKKTTERYEEEDEPEGNDPDEGEDEEEEDDDAAEDPSADDAEDPPPPAAPPPPKKKATPPPPERAKNALAGARTLEAHLGLRNGSSLPAIKGAAIPRLVAYNALCAAHGVDPRDPEALLGADAAMRRDAAETPVLRKRARDAERVSEGAEREKILDDLVRTGKHDRAEVWQSYVAKKADGTREKRRRPQEWCGPEKKKDGQRVGMSLASLRSYAKAATVKRAPSTPFEQPADETTTPAPGADAIVSKYGLKPASVQQAAAAVTAAINGAQRAPLTIVR